MTWTDYRPWRWFGGRRPPFAHEGDPRMHMAGGRGPRGRGRPGPPHFGGGPRPGSPGFPFGPHRGFPGPFFGRGPKAGRGDVRTGILLLLNEQPMNGYQIIQTLAERSGGLWRPSPGSVYPTLQQLEDEGLIRAEQSDDRRLYHLTEQGRAHVAARSIDAAAPWDTVAGAADSRAIELRDLLGQIGAAVMQVMHAGTDTQVASARDLLAETRRSLYRILADDAPQSTAKRDDTATL
ncbi:MAG: PadR family transcriptional regulator [Dehalococcoidia bacterium]